MQSASKYAKYSTSYGDLERRAAAKNIPLYAHLDLTYRCNLKCVHCYAVNEPDRQELTTDEVKDILDQLADAGSLYLILSGGEAMLRKDYFEIAQYAKTKGFALRLMTNGTLINEENVKIIAKLCPLYVELSLYAMSEDVHDAITKVPGSFTYTLATIYLLKRFNTNIYIKTIAMQQNLDEIESVQHFSEKIHAKFLKDSVINPKLNNDISPLKYRLSDEQLIRFLNATSPQWKFQEYNLNDTLCNAGKGHVTINPYGEVFPCLRIQKKAGDLRKQSFQEIWSKSLILKQIRELTATEIKSCATCEEMDYCNPCPGLALMEHGDLLKPSEECCRQAKLRKKAFGQPKIRKYSY